MLPPSSSLIISTSAVPSLSSVPPTPPVPFEPSTGPEETSDGLITIGDFLEAVFSDWVGMLFPAVLS